MSNGKTQGTEIANAVNIKASQISKYLSILAEYGLPYDFPIEVDYTNNI